MKRLVIVYNLHSSKYTRVKKEVLDHAPTGWVGYDVDNSLDVDGNAEKLAKFIASGDRIISAGGDGTATICVNAIVLSKLQQEVEFGVLPYGNFNDMSRNFGHQNIFQLASPKAKISNVYPLELIVDGKHRRYAVSYYTIGLFAESTQIFDHSAVRSKLRSGRKTSILYSVRQLSSWYFRNRRRQFLPSEFELNGKIIKKATDYVAVNGFSMAGLMRNRSKLYKTPKTFLSNTDNLSSYIRLFKMIIPSILWQIPGKRSAIDTLHFTQPTTVEVQGEGEYMTLRDISTIEIHKIEAPLKVITTKTN